MARSGRVDTVVAAAVCVAGVELGDIHHHFGVAGVALGDIGLAPVARSSRSGRGGRRRRLRGRRGTW